ncbi:MAG: cobalamin-binding protein [Stenotrophobium sp.]
MSLRTLIFAALLFCGPAHAVQRVITLAPNLAELACAAGGCDQLVGVVSYSDYPPQVAKLPHIGDAYALNLEQIIALKPDLILSWPGGTSPQTVSRLRDLGLKVEPVTVQGLDGVADAIEHLGALLGTPAAAATAAIRYRQRLQALRVRYRDAVKLRVMYQIEASPAFTVNRRSTISDVITLCGGINVFAGLPQIAAPVNKESVIAANPDVVIYGRQDDARAVREYWRAFGQATVEKNHDLYAVDDDLLARSTPRLLDGAAQVCAALDQARAKRKPVVH